jgi:hypothetical protein
MQKSHRKTLPTEARMKGWIALAAGLACTGALAQEPAKTDSGKVAPAKADAPKAEPAKAADGKAKIDLQPPTMGAYRIPQIADFPFVKRYPGARLKTTERNGPPLMVVVDKNKDAVQVAGLTVVKEYEAAPGMSANELLDAYREAFKRAGWTVVHEATAVTVKEPNITAHYAKAPYDLWARVQAKGPTYVVAVGDVAAERAGEKPPASGPQNPAKFNPPSPPPNAPKFVPPAPPADLKKLVPPSPPSGQQPQNLPPTSPSTPTAIK